MKPKALILSFLLSFIFSFLSGQSEVFRYAIPGSDGSVSQFEVDTLGNNYIVGSYNDLFSYGDLSITGNPQTEGDLYLLKTTPSGEPVYLHSINGTGNGDAVSLRKFIVKESGELYIAFATNGISELVIGRQTLDLSTSLNPTVIAKFSKTGFLEWTKTLFAEGAQPSLIVNDIDIDVEGNVFVAGDFSGANANLDGTTVSGLESVNKIFLVKYLADGTNSWGSTCGHTTDTVGNIFANNIEVSPEGTIYLSGSHNGGRQFIFNKDYLRNRGVTNAYLSAFDADGNTLWAIPYEGDGTILPGMISLDKQGNAAFSCFYKTTSMLVNGNSFSSITDYDLLISHVQSDRNFNWTYPLNTNLTFASAGDNYAKIRIGSDTNLYIVGEALDINSFVYFLSFSPDGVVNWIQMTSGVGNAYLDNAYIDIYGNCFVGGISYDSFDFGGTTIEDLSGNGSSYVLGALITGVDVFAFQRQNNPNDILYFTGVGADNYHNLFFAGNFTGNNVNLGEHFLSENSSSGVYLAEYGLVGSISGKVQDFYSTPVKGMVKLIGYTYLQESPMADSVEIQADGSFEFTNVPLGKYLLITEPDNSEGISYMQTYFPTTGSWEQGEHIILDAFNLEFSNLMIIVPEQPEFTGDSRISGEVSIIEEVDVFKGIMKKPRAKSKATLAKAKPKSDYQVIAVTESDGVGFFEFENVENGEYIILIDIPGLPNINPHNVTVTNGQFISNVNYFVSEETVTGIDNPSGTEFFEPAGENIVLVYPNPNQGSFKVESTKGKQIDSVTIFNIQGKEIKQYDRIQAKLTVTGLENGIYIVNAVSDGENYKFKLIVNR